MLYLVIFLFILCLPPILLILLKIDIIVEYIRNKSDDHFVLSFYALWGYYRLKYEIPMIDFEKNGFRIKRYTEQGLKEKDYSVDKENFEFGKLLEKAEYFRSFYSNNKGMICDLRDYLRKRFVIKNLELDMRIGTGDAHYTALLNGAAWALYGIIISYVTSIIKLEKKKINIRSEFSKKVLSVNLFCILRVKFVHIIIIVLRLRLYYLQEKRKNKNSGTGGETDGGTSHTRTYDHSNAKHKGHG